MALTRNPRTRKIEKKGKRKQPPGLREANQENKRRSPANEFSSAEACPVSGAFTSFFFVFIHFLLFQRRPSANFVGLAAKRCYEGGRQKKHNRKEPFPFKAKKKRLRSFLFFFPARYDAGDSSRWAALSPRPCPRAHPSRPATNDLVIRSGESEKNGEPSEDVVQ